MWSCYVVQSWEGGMRSRFAGLAHQSASDNQIEAA